jgi:hypothetical protein
MKTMPHENRHNIRPIHSAPLAPRPRLPSTHRRAGLDDCVRGGRSVRSWADVLVFFNAVSSSAS